MKKNIILSMLLASTSWAGWHLTPEHEELAKQKAKHHPFAGACAKVSSGYQEGSGILLQEDVIATAAHVVAPDDDYLSSVSGPFKVTRQHCSVCLGGEGDIAYYSSNYVLYDRASDLAFIILNQSVDKETSVLPRVASIDDQQRHEASFDPVKGLNAPRLSGAFKGGLSIEYIGYGYILLPEANMKKNQLLTIQQHYTLQARGACRGGPVLGALQLSQYFSGSGFYGWMNLDKSYAAPYSSALPGDSGAGALTVGDDPRVFAVVSKIQAPEVPFDNKRTVLTQFAPLQSMTSDDKSTWWESFLRLKQ